MNVLFITHYDGLYGSSKSLLNLLDGLRKYDVEPFVILPLAGDLQQELAARGIPCKILPVIWWVSDKPNSFRSIIRFIIDLCFSVIFTLQKIKDWKIDLVYSNSSVFPIGRIISLLYRVPHIWHIREFGDLDFSLHFYLPKGISRRFIQSSSAIICNSKAVSSYYFRTRNKKHVQIIYNGIAPCELFDKHASQKALTEQSNIYTFLIIGAISLKKGQESAIRALAELHKRGFRARMIIAGIGSESYVGYCTNLVEEEGISDFIKFTGYVSNPYEVYFKSDCLLMCSEWEAFGRVTAEAMSACLPVIGRNSGGTPELIEHGKTGLLYNTFEVLVECMAKMVENPEYGRQLGLEGWRVAKERFTIEAYAAKVFSAIKSVSPG